MTSRIFLRTHSLASLAGDSLTGVFLTGVFLTGVFLAGVLLGVVAVLDSISVISFLAATALGFFPAFGLASFSALGSLLTASLGLGSFLVAALGLDSFSA